MHPCLRAAGPFAATGPNNALLSRLPAVVSAWRPGEEGGNAILDILTGAANPSGHLTANWVRGVGADRGPANPYFQARGSPNSKAYVTEPSSPLFPFGFGLGYNTPTITSAAVQAPPGPLGADSVVNVTGVVSNAGPAGAVTLQVYFSQVRMMC